MDNRKLVINAAVVAAEAFDDETVVIHFDTGRYFSLGGSGPWIWKAFEQPCSVESIAQAVPNADADEISAFIDKLMGEDLLIAIAADAAAGEPLTPLSKWEAPSIEVFSDLADLIQLDPVHEVDASAGWPRRREQG